MACLPAQSILDPGTNDGRCFAASRLARHLGQYYSSDWYSFFASSVHCFSAHPARWNCFYEKSAIQISCVLTTQQLLIICILSCAFPSNLALRLPLATALRVTTVLDKASGTSSSSLPTFNGLRQYLSLTVLPRMVQLSIRGGANITPPRRHRRFVEVMQHRDSRARWAALMKHAPCAQVKIFHSRAWRFARWLPSFKPNADGLDSFTNTIPRRHHWRFATRIVLGLTIFACNLAQAFWAY
ncbi:hypothetical protein BU23DRAFT_236844 [Bimuria novae-zelandiae CBS 107.79]|uniref:Uncharacterized protein n=1 Tax=Bimuria novae-zelandiae CBS 107.79 TaxID=1447943 RepID=A0A6A5V011_9PLEO|nr:hypothetical protein BU23DRAFT_236844 [Bimuria novae-zelandiae CBS 107.79]